ncbi:hypothetical protein Btru_026047 [Bulinus truncatus]|nr:hypothetical protein Btru_026047 [Bulinus truncatus]
MWEQAMAESTDNTVKFDKILNTPYNTINDWLLTYCVGILTTFLFYEMFPKSSLFVPCVFLITKCWTVSSLTDWGNTLADVGIVDDGNSTGLPDNNDCDPNYCQVTNPCDENMTCVTVGCNATVCFDSNPNPATPSLQHHCANITDEDCPDPSFCPALINCVCLVNWIGTNCMTPCPLQCVNGGCRARPDDQSPYCNCQSSWEGDYCDQLVVSPEESERRARQEEEKRVRIMAGVVTGAVAFALIVAIVIPVVLWRMRVIFVMKLVYYFKRYEDNDDKLYDVYVSMTPTANAEKFVYGDLRPKLENLGFTLYLQARDSLPGQVMSESILEAVEKSRCTIMIVTPDYITNEWNRFEYLIAQHETIKLNQKIIPIILEQIDTTNMDKSLKHILDSIKCLKHPMTKKPTSSEQRQDISYYSAWTYPPEKSSPNSYSVVGAEEKYQNKFEKVTENFWKRLELTLPKKKKNTTDGKEQVTYDNIYVNTKDLESKFTDGKSSEKNSVATEDKDSNYTKMNSCEQSDGTVDKDVSFVQLNSSLLGILDVKEMGHSLANCEFVNHL